jgi:hypothetical protein
MTTAHPRQVHAVLGVLLINRLSDLSINASQATDKPLSRASSISIPT